MTFTVTTSFPVSGIALISFSNPPVNALATGLQAQLSKSLKSLQSRSDVRAIILYGANSPGFFSSGADINQFQHISGKSTPFNEENTYIYDGSENSSIPVIAAIDGICFGGGLELVLCCAARIATKVSSFCLPESSIGLLPGLGGTQRLPRLVGFQLGLEMMLKAKPITSDIALKNGLIDFISQNHHHLINDTIKYVQNLLSSGQKIIKTIERNDKIGSIKSCEMISNQIKKTILPKLSKNGQLPQYEVLLDTALYGVKYGGKKGKQEELKAFVKLAVSPHSRGLIHTFFSTRKTSKIDLIDNNNESSLNYTGTIPKKVGVIGGGLMGAGIATACILADIPVVIKELNEKFALAAKSRVEKNLGPIKKSKISKLIVTTDYNELSNVDIVIEAALENPLLKQKIFKELELVCHNNCIIATNTSTINIDLIGMGAPKAYSEGRIIGAHFFSPAHKMPLLEIVRTESTNIKIIKDVIAFGKKIKKTCVLVGNCAGFAVNRMYFPQSMVASFITSTLGIHPYRIDNVCESFGLPMGPYKLVDLVGLDIGVAVGGVFEMAYAERTIPANPAMTEMLKAGRKGQKTGKGFYSYQGKSRVGQLDEEGIESFLKKADENIDENYKMRIRKNFGEISDDDIVNMILLACVNEGIRILDEGIVQKCSDLDICSIMGMAFPAHKGGLMYWAQQTFGGSVGMLSELERYYKNSEHFPLFKPSFALTRAAKQNKPIGTIVKPALSNGNMDDIVIVSAYRTAVGRASRGGFKDTLPDDMIIPVLQKILEDTKIQAKDVGDIVTGAVLQRGDTSVVQLRVAGMLSGFPETVPVKVVNRLCSSGLQAIADSAASITAGHHNIIVAGGFESMSSASMNNKEIKPNAKVRKAKDVMGCYMSMGQTSENVAEKYGISRDRQDRLAVVSHARASLAKLSGRQKSEIVPIATKKKIIDRQTKEEIGIKDIVVSEDEGVRVGVTMDALAKLPAVFKRGGSTTPGNSSQLSDGAALVMMMKRSEAQQRGLNAMATLRSFAAVGVDPATMGIGPVAAIPVALERAGISVDDVDLFELNEAFGSQADYCIEKLGLNRDIVNVMGGAIAIGHPLGMTGARQTVSIIHELHRRGGRFGVVSMCVGTGMGAAAVYEINKESTLAKM